MFGFSSDVFSALRPEETSLEVNQEIRSPGFLLRQLKRI